LGLRLVRARRRGFFSIMWGNLLKPPSSGAFIPQDIEMIRGEYDE
jgi:hypothetical protein